LIAGRRLHYVDAGAGERAFALVHGMGGELLRFAGEVKMVDHAQGR
jgi:hypothetical protein